MLGGFWNAAVLLPPLPGLLDTQGIPPSYIQPPSLWWKSALCKFLKFFFYQLWPEWRLFRSFLPREQTSITAGLSGTKLITAKAKGQYIKAECNNPFSWRLSWFPYKCRKLYLNVHLSGIRNANGEVIFMSLCFDLLVEWNSFWHSCHPVLLHRCLSRVNFNWNKWQPMALMQVIG